MTAVMTLPSYKDVPGRVLSTLRARSTGDVAGFTAVVAASAGVCGVVGDGGTGVMVGDGAAVEDMTIAVSTTVGTVGRVDGVIVALATVVGRGGCITRHILTTTNSPTTVAVNNHQRHGGALASGAVVGADSSASFNSSVGVDGDSIEGRVDVGSDVDGSVGAVVVAAVFCFSPLRTRWR